MKKAAFLIILALSTVHDVLGQEPASDANLRPAVSATSPNGGKVAIPPEKSQPITIPKAVAAPKIDGHLNEEDGWKQAAVFKDFYQTSPGYNTAPSRPTEVYMMYDEYNLYIAFKCWDEKDKIRATQANRDNVFGEDNVRIFLDTYNDQRRAYVLGFNPLGVQQDGIFTEGQGGDFSVDIVMDSKGAIEEWGWSVEVKIPFRSLRYAGGKGKLWGFNAARNIDRFNREFNQWLPDDRDVSGFLLKHGKITGLDDIKYERTLEIVPSITLSETGERVSAREFAAGRFVNHQVKKDIGVNLKYTISPNVTLDAAINPDYAEIEADAPVVTANQRFPIYFQEKRPFFLEGKEIFDTPLQVFYSRNIVDPDIALKVTGKINKTSFGILAASDNAPGNYSEDERTRNEQCKTRLALGLSTRACPLDEFLDKNAFFTIVRVKRDFGASNNVGLYGTARVFPQNRNYTAGLDGTFRFSSTTAMKFQALGTFSRKNFYNPELNKSEYRNGTGLGYFWSVDQSRETRGWYAEVSGRSKDYRADSGFTQRTNTNQALFVNRRSTRSNPKATVIRWNFNQVARYNFDWRGRTQSAGLSGNVSAQIQGSMFVNFEGGLEYEKNYEEDGFGPKRNPVTGQQGAFYGAPTRSAWQPFISVFVNKSFNKHFGARMYTSVSLSSFDYDFGGGPRYPRVSPAALALGPSAPLDPGPGTQLNIGGGFTYKPITPLVTSLEYTKSKLTRNDTGLVAYDTNIFTWRTTYKFTRFTFARVRWDYDTLSSRAAGQFLLGWNPNPGTAFYVGYNDTLKYNGFSPFTGQLEQGFARQSRTFFIRASYLFRRSF